MKNPYTTIAGVAGGIGTVLTPVAQGQPIDWTHIIIGCVLAILGVLSKDYNTTGNGSTATKENTD